jgi:predicted AlkP superfamily phosphohydrolase/phosphomutase
MTGKNPGKHGIFSFVQREIGTYERRIANPEVVKSSNLWQVLSKSGKRVGVLNVPMSSYEGVNGFMVPGFLDGQEGVPQPESLRENIKSKFSLDLIPGDVETDVLSRARSDPDLLLDRIFKITEVLAEVSLYLAESEEWDLFMTVFMGTDRIGHFFWKYADISHSEYALNEFSERFREYYRMMDDIISQFLEIIPEKTVVVLVSDHGFCPVSREVYLNNYLQELGYLVTTNDKVNLKESKVVARGYGDIWLNVKGREPHGVLEWGSTYDEVVENIIESLEELKIDGEKPIQEVVRREKVYWGPYVSEAPDLLAVFNPEWQSARRPEIIEPRIDKRYVNDDPLWCGGHDGIHNPQEVPGILGFLGANLIEDGIPLRTHLWDLAPTILKVMDVPIPKDMDGKPLPILKQRKVRK